jgi:hypothetical protein
VNVVYVRNTGSPILNGIRLLEAYGGITDADSSNPWLVKVEPGTYDLGSTTLTMQPFVSLEGSGIGSTTITRTGGSGLGSATIRLASSTEIRFLTVANSGAAGYYSVAVYGSNVSTANLTHVALGAGPGSGESHGLYLSGAAVTLESVSLDASGGSVTRGITLRDLSTLIVRQSDLTVHDGTSLNVGLDLHRSAVRLENVNLQVITPPGSASTNVGLRLLNPPGETMGLVEVLKSAVVVSFGEDAYGLDLANGSLSVASSKVMVVNAVQTHGAVTLNRTGGHVQGSNLYGHGTSWGYGVNTTPSESGWSLRIDSSKVYGTTKSIYGSEGYAISVGASQLSGPVDPSTGTVTCVGCYNASYGNAGGFTACP